MDIFLEKHKEAILGVVEGFDRVIFKGYLTSMFPDGGFEALPLQAGHLAQERWKIFRTRNRSHHPTRQDSAEQADRPYAYLESAHTHASGQSKEAKARAIAERDGITEGLVAILLGFIEPCSPRLPSLAITKRTALKSFDATAGVCTCTGIGSYYV